MRPLDHKLKYQIDKLVRTAVTGSLGETHQTLHILLDHERLRLYFHCLFITAENDPLQLRPNPENLMSKVRPGFQFLSLSLAVQTLFWNALKYSVQVV